ncbi:VIT1/CCC1 transporter family protein [Sporolactobacillus sp. Y61]|uniref:VIT1/CCC1 transporter family protein n=1 Tax=Sporolactobacillus sp. Y61 TaxID=3160863 RepID=A0AAU8ID75_9BACL|nr:VIT1/CCC1 transporter family protein [Sporolactobacillus sp. THM19-2]RYL92200.1 hypothetical protein EWH91_08195 [Sporolactobacillus sp. THM19-2]
MTVKSKRLLYYQRQVLLHLSLFRYWEKHLIIEHNRKTYGKIAVEEERLASAICPDHPNMENVNHFRFFVALSKLLGFTFVTQLMMKAKKKRIKKLSESSIVPVKYIQLARTVFKQEKDLIAQLRERRLDFVGAIILGMNDALVEITGSVAGFTLSMSNTKIIAVAGLITGVAASLSMAASEFMAERSEGNMKKAARAAIYTGGSYFLTVVLLVLPFFILPAQSYIPALILTVIIAVAVIFIFSFYMSVAKEIRFSQRFWEMVIVSLGVAVLTFFIGFIVKTYFGIAA